MPPRTVEGIFLDPQQISDVKRALGRKLAGWRRSCGLTQGDVARLVHSTRSTVANVESGRQVVDRVFWVQCDSLLRAGGELVTGYDGTGPRRPGRRRRRLRRLVMPVGEQSLIMRRLLRRARPSGSRTATRQSRR
ncbi:helix-turn-helix transcriptional regulator [Plantactinospora sp. KBS50]|uniref:helix-turn-helix domain-containing protein n=1 Tax=Plantactinospora sp. KBS50 TaxID=2024580 RepID=UPI001E60DB9F|nr:helix-turn-helix transcriptional regulator [Plantactinospora sp. KBS50]